MSTMTPSQQITVKTATLDSAKALLWAVVDTVRETPNGAPEGIMYMAFQQKGIPIDVFQMITNVAVETGMCTRKGHVLYPGPKVHLAHKFKPSELG